MHYGVMAYVKMVKCRTHFISSCPLVSKGANVVMFTSSGSESTFLACPLLPSCSNVHSAIHRINLYPLDNTIGFPNSYRLDRDLFSVWCYPHVAQLGPCV